MPAIDFSESPLLNQRGDVPDDGLSAGAQELCQNRMAGYAEGLAALLIGNQVKRTTKSRQETLMPQKMRPVGHRAKELGDTLVEALLEWRVVHGHMAHHLNIHFTQPGLGHGLQIEECWLPEGLGEANQAPLPHQKNRLAIPDRPMSDPFEHADLDDRERLGASSLALDKFSFINRSLPHGLPEIGVSFFGESAKQASRSGRTMRTNHGIPGLAWDKLLHGLTTHLPCFVVLPCLIVKDLLAK